jgi:hypothetical protein
VLHTPSGSGDKIKFEHKVLTKGDEPRDVPVAGGMTEGANDAHLLNIKGKRSWRRRSPGTETKSSFIARRTGPGSPWWNSRGPRCEPTGRQREATTQAMREHWTGVATRLEPGAERLQILSSFAASRGHNVCVPKAFFQKAYRL